MISVSRRKLSRFAADQLLAGENTLALSRQLASVLITTKKVSEAELLVKDIVRELEDRGVLAEVNVSSANSLPDKLIKQISQFIKQTTGVSNVILQNHVEPELIGGVRIETANQAWDTTISKKIEDIRKGI